MRIPHNVLMHDKIKTHGENLNTIFATNLDPIILCKKLHNMESRMHKIALDYCNGNIDEDHYDKATQRTMHKLDLILHFYRDNIPVFINSDPRGYALKIDDSYIRDNNIVIERDWGGYGLIAPDFS